MNFVGEIMYKSAEALLSRLDSLPAKHRDVLKEYYEDNSLNNSAYQTCENKLLQLIKFAKYFNKPFIEITKQDIKEYLIQRQNELKPSSLSICKSILKNFFKWLYNTDDYPECVRWIKTGYANSGNDFPNGVLNPEEVKLMINKAESVQRKAIISVLYDSAVRVGELVGMNINDIEFDENGSFIVVDGKTGKRIIRFINSQNYLSMWLDIHPYKDKLNNSGLSKKYPLWVSESTPTWGKRLTISGVYGIVRFTAEDADIKKKVSPHKLRHARLTDLAKKGLNESTLKILAGWTGSSSMPEVYIHLSGRDAANTLLQVEKQGYVKPEIVKNPLIPNECPRCKTE